MLRHILQCGGNAIGRLVELFRKRDVFGLGIIGIRDLTFDVLELGLGLVNEFVEFSFFPSRTASMICGHHEQVDKEVEYYETVYELSPAENT